MNFQIKFYLDHTQHIEQPSQKLHLIQLLSYTSLTTYFDQHAAVQYSDFNVSCFPNCFYEIGPWKEEVDETVQSKCKYFDLVGFII